MANQTPSFCFAAEDIRIPLLHASLDRNHPERQRHVLGRLLVKPVQKFHKLLTSARSFFNSAWQSIKEDPRRVIHSLKMAFALSLAFLLVLVEAPYEQLGSHAIWAILTVVVVFELTVGATLSKGLNRGIGTLVAGLLAIVVGELARMGGEVGHPIIIGISVFIIGGTVTYGKLLPPMKSYEFGFRTFLITFCLIMVTGYRIGNPLTTAVNRFLVIALGGTIGLVINLFILPSWAGEELHEFVSKNFSSVADSLEVCVQEYLRGRVLERAPTKIIMGQVADDPVYKGYRAALFSASKEETLANFAIWEPPHGQFRMLKYPWKQYVKVGAVLRHCAYSVVALHGCLRCAIQAPLKVRKIFESELLEVSMESAKVLRELGTQVSKMQRGKTTNSLVHVHRAVARLQKSLYLHSYLLVKEETGILDDLNLSISVMSNGRSLNGEHPDGLVHGLPRHVHSTNILNMLAIDSGDTNGIREQPQLKKLNSWPSRDTNDLCCVTTSMLEQRVRVLESASALSLGTFASLLVEVVARLEYVVNAVEELSQLAKFKLAVGEGESSC
eukprot:c15778_g1_i1 orf=683-2353(-)